MAVADLATRREWLRFLPKVDIKGTNDCWLWLGKSQVKVPQFYRALGPVKIHRFFYRAVIGPLSKHDHLKMVCKNWHCLNPRHFIKHSEIIHNKIQTTAYMGHCRNGHRLDYTNLYISIRPSGLMQRRCKACHKLRNQAYYHRKKVGVS